MSATSSLTRGRDVANAFSWRISNFNTPAYSGSIDSDLFELEGFYDIFWYLHCRYRYESQQLHHNDWHEFFNAEFKFYLVRDYQNLPPEVDDFSELELLIDYRFDVIMMYQGRGNELTNFYPNRKVFNNEIDDLKPSVWPIKQLPNELEVYFTVTRIKIIKPSLDVENEIVSTIAPVINGFLAEEQFADVKLIVSGEQFKASKLLLAAHSPVFKSMFSQEMVEKRTNTVEIDDISADVFKAFLHYIYLGPFNEITEFWGQLIQLADKYQVEVLKKLCEEHLIKSISINNCLELLEIGDLSNSKKLVDANIEFIKQNRNNLEPIESFEEFFKKRPEMMTKLRKTFAKN